VPGRLIESPPGFHKRPTAFSRSIAPADIRTALDQINDPHGVPILPLTGMFVAAAQLTRNGIAINYDGAYDNDDWNAVGDIFPPLVHWTVENLAFVEHESYLCDPTHPLCPVQ
jgi:hypothetical protein